MAVKYWVDLDLQQNELQNVVIGSLATAPTHKAGRIYFDSVHKKIMVSNGTLWMSLGGVSAVENVGSGSGIWKVTENDIIKLRSIVGSNFLRVTQGADALTLSIDTELAVTGSNTKLPTSSAVKNYADQKIAKIDIDTSASVLASTSESKVPSTAAAKKLINEAVSSGLTGFCEYVGTFDASKGVKVNIPGAIKKGQFWKVSVAGTASGLISPSNADGKLNVGDMLIASQDLGEGVLPTVNPDGSGGWGSVFDVIDNTEAPDIVRLEAAQTLKNKSISASYNSITGINGNNFNPEDVLSSSDIEAFIAFRSLYPNKIVGEGLIIDLLRSVVRSYSASISGTSGTISKTAHKLGQVTNVMVLGSAGNIAMVDVVINQTTQTVTWTTAQAFSGKIIISGKGI